MFDEFTTRMEQRGAYMGDALRNQSQVVIENTFLRDPSTVLAYVGGDITYDVAHKYKPVAPTQADVPVKFMVVKNYTVNSDQEVEHLAQFRLADVEQYDIAVGKYLYVPKTNEWWLLVHYSDELMFRKFTILKCNYTFRWIANGIVYSALGVRRSTFSDSSGVSDDKYMRHVKGSTVAVLPDNAVTRTVSYDTRMIMCNERRNPLLVFKVSRVDDMTPEGVVTFVYDQDVYNASTDYDAVADSENPQAYMVADYHKATVAPVVDAPAITRTCTITYSGTKPTIKVGGTARTYTAQFSDITETVTTWSVSDGTSTFATSTADYILTTSGNALTLAISKRYALIGTVLTLTVTGTQGSTNTLQIEVVG